jgi:hypothetical protein
MLLEHLSTSQIDMSDMLHEFAHYMHTMHAYDVCFVLQNASHEICSFSEALLIVKI